MYGFRGFIYKRKGNLQYFNKLLKATKMIETPENKKAIQDIQKTSDKAVELLRHFEDDSKNSHEQKRHKKKNKGKHQTYEYSNSSPEFSDLSLIERLSGIIFPTDSASPGISSTEKMIGICSLFILSLLMLPLLISTLLNSSPSPSEDSSVTSDHSLSIKSSREMTLSAPLNS